MKLPLLVTPRHGSHERVAPSEGIDCVVIGPHIGELHELIERAKSTEGISAHYDDVLLNSVLMGGRRLSYADVLNRALTIATGRPHKLSPFLQPSSAVCHLVSFLRARGLNTEYVNFFTFEKDRLRDLLSQRPRAVAITTTFYVETDPMAEVVRFVREHSPDTKIIIGGPYIFRNCSNYDEITQDYLLQDIGADYYIFDSQGESTLAALLAALRGGGKDPGSVPNLIWTRDNLTFTRTPRAIENNDLDANPVDWSLFERDFILPTVYLRTARSCPFACTFCSYPIMAGDHVMNELDVIMAQLRYLAENGVENVVFVDDTFNVPLPRFKALLKRMIEDKLGLRWMSFFRCSNADPEAFELMGKSGCALSFLGIESADERLLKNMDKFARVDRYREGIRRLHENGINSHVSLIVGFPGETERSVETTMQFLEETRPTTYGSQIFYHDPRTPLQERAGEFGLKGTGFAWQHATAEWPDAVRWMRQMMERIDTTEWVGGYSLGPWGMFYLLTLGYTMDQLRAFLRVTQGMVLEGLDGREATGMDRLVSIFRPEAELAACRSI